MIDVIIHIATFSITIRGVQNTRHDRHDRHDRRLTPRCVRKTPHPEALRWPSGSPWAAVALVALLSRDIPQHGLVRDQRPHYINIYHTIKHMNIYIYIDR